MKKSTSKSGSETVSSSVEIENETQRVLDEAATESTQSPRDVLSVILRDGAQKMLQAAIQKEVDDFSLTLLTKQVGSWSFATGRCLSVTSSQALDTSPFVSRECVTCDRLPIAKSSCHPSLGTARQ